MKIIKHISIFFSIILLFFINFCFLTGCSSQNNTSQQKEHVVLEQATLTKYVDGDTFYVSTDNNPHMKIRLIGVDTPESVNPDTSKNTQEGIIASDYIKQTLPINSTIYLERDEELTDKYNRELRYVWLKQPQNTSQQSIETNMLNGILLKQKLARTLFIEPNTKYKTELTNIKNSTQ